MLTSMKPRFICTLAALVAVSLGAAQPQAAELLIFGEVHDQPDQQRQVADEVQRLAAAGRLSALVLEMAEAPHTSAGLPRDASAAQVQQALHWRGWDWPRYAAVVMNAVRAGVPVLGGNLPREQMRAAMADPGLEASVSPAVRERLAQEVRDGHCGLLPEARIVPMTRVQIARDRAMAQAVVKARRPGRTVLLVTGAAHADRQQGVPQHLPVDVTVRSPRLLAASDANGDVLSTTRYDATWRTPPRPEKDFCAELRPSR